MFNNTCKIRKHNIYYLCRKKEIDGPELYLKLSQILEEIEVTACLFSACAFISFKSIVVIFKLIPAANTT